MTISSFLQRSLIFGILLGTFVGPVGVSAQGVRTGTTITAPCAEGSKTAFGDQLKSAACIPVAQPCTNADQVIGQGTCQEGYYCCATMNAADACQAAAKAAGGQDKDGTCQTANDCSKNKGVSVPVATEVCGAGYICCSITPTITGYSSGPVNYFNTYGYQPPLGSTTIPQLVGRFISQVLPLIGALFFLMFLWGGFQWFTSAGDEKKVGSARVTLVNASIGIAIVIFSYSLVSYLLTVFAAGFAG
jgi:hypothetical protein